MRTALLVAAALVGFAANSLLCRLALAAQEIDAATFTGVRIASGAIVLTLLATGRPSVREGWRARALSAAALFAYAAPFSYAYLRLGAAVGALVLFGAVQITMIGAGIARGERPKSVVWLGLAAALAGLVGLTVPGATAPDPIGAITMTAAGVAWGAYCLRGRTVANEPLVATARSFASCVPLAAALVVVGAIAHGLHASLRGILVAVISGALASGVAYSLWYAALRDLSATRAAVLQLVVPVLAALLAVVVLDERITFRLAVACVAILGGVALALRGRE